MANSPKKDGDKPTESDDQKRDTVLRRMLETPPKPHVVKKEREAEASRSRLGHEDSSKN